MVFSVAMRDQLGLTQEMSFLNSLIKLHDQLIDKMIVALDQKVCEIMDQEDYKLVEVLSAED